MSDDAIRLGEVLPLKVFLEKARLRKHAWSTAVRAARKFGIKLDLRHGRNCYVHTDRWLQYLEAVNEQGES